MGIQVYSLTHSGEGSALSPMSKQFISFSWGNKNIEDFNLIVVFGNNRLEKDFYAPFSDATSEYHGVDGQYYWETTINPLQINFTLATDGMTTVDYANFQKWFTPGTIRKLVLAEAPNRYCYARLAAAPSMSFVPFQDNKTVTIGGETHTYRTTLYKGEVTLSFVADDPFWYAEKSIIDLNNLEESDLREIAEGGIPSASTLPEDVPCYLADNYYWTGSAITPSATHIGQPLDAGETAYLYNCSSSYVKPNISMYLTPGLDDDGYATFGGNLINTLSIGSQILTYSMPSVYSAYNRAIELASNLEIGDSYVDFLTSLQTEVTNYYTRAYAVAAANNTAITLVSAEGAILEGFSDAFIAAMEDFIIEGQQVILNFDTATGTARMSTAVAQFGTSEILEIEINCGDCLRSRYLIIGDISTHGENGKIEEDDLMAIQSSCDIDLLKIVFKYTYL